MVTVSSLLWVKQSRGQMVHFGHTEGVDGLVPGQDDGQTGKTRKEEFLLQQKVMGVSKGRKPVGNLD